MYLAASRGELLISEDLFYRTIAASLTKIDGTWLQVVFLAALVAGQMDRTRYAKACAQLAYRRHGNLWLDDVALSMISEECSAHEFAAACHYIGSSNAHMWSHTVLVTRFLRRIWYRPSIGLKRENLTSTVIGALLRPRREDWHYCLAVLWMAAEGNSSLRGYLVAWIHGHFLPVAPINAAKSELRLFLRQKFRPSS